MKLTTNTTTIGQLYWAWDYSNRCMMVFANHPAAGKLPMGRTVREARECAATCDWMAK